MDLSSVITTKAIAAYIETVASNKVPFLGATIFPNAQKAGLDLSWFKSSNGLPISLMPSAFDAKATFRDRIGLSKFDTEMPFFREGFKIKEKDRQEILRAQDVNDRYLQAVIKNIYKDAENLIDGAEVVAERERMALLFPAGGDMQIIFTANGVDYSYNYDPNGSWKTTNYKALTGTKVWSNVANADPFKDIDNAKKAIREKTGNELAYMVMNGTTADYLFATDAVKNRFLATSGITVGYLTRDDAKEAVEKTTGLKVVIYDKMYKNESGTAAKFAPDGYVSFIPEGAVGETMRGTTPEEADLLNGTDVDVTIINDGVAITKIVDAHPVNTNIFASEIVLPTFEGMDDVYTLKVTA